MRRSSRNRSRTRERRDRYTDRRDSRSRHSARPESRGHRRSRSRPSFRRSPLQDQEDPSWQSSSTHFDTQLVYGLNLPRTVESTQWSRKAQIAGAPVEQVKLVDVMYGGLQNWGLRIIANGRFSALEVFRSRQEAMVASSLFKEIYNQKDDVDLTKVLKHFAPANSNLDDFTVKQQAVKSLCANIVDHLKQYMPVDQNQQMLQELEKLRQENQALKANQGTPPPASTIPAMFQPSTGANASQPSQPNAIPPSQAFLDQYRKPASAPAILGTSPPESHTKGKIDAWIKRHVPKEEQPKIEAMVEGIRDAHSKIPPGDRPSFEPLLSEWGLTSTVLSKCNLEAQIKLLASVQLAKN